jgi:hypothetical protein
MSTVPSFEPVPELGPAPPATNNVSTLLIGLSATKPMPMSMKPAWFVWNVVLLQLPSSVSTRNSSPELYNTHATALRSTDMEYGVCGMPNRSFFAGQLSRLVMSLKLGGVVLGSKLEKRPS